MAIEQNFSIRKGSTEQIEIVVDNVNDWTNLLAKLFADYDMETSAPEVVLAGVIDAVKNTITFTFTKDILKDFEAQTSLRYETTVYKADGTYIQNTNYGLLNIAPAVKLDPTI